MPRHSGQPQREVEDGHRTPGEASFRRVPSLNAGMGELPPQCGRSLVTLCL